MKTLTREPQASVDVTTTTYLGKTFKDTQGRVFILWRYSPPLYPNDKGEYTAVELLEPSKGVETVCYATSKHYPYSELHRLENVNPNSHFSIPANRVGEVLRNPTILSDAVEHMKDMPVRKPKKIIKTSRLG